MKNLFKGKKDSNSGGDAAPKRSPFNLDSLRGQMKHGLSQKLFMIIKSEGHVVDAYKVVHRERQSQARELSEWGESTTDDAVDDLTDKIGVILNHIGEVENTFATRLEESRGLLKIIRNLEEEVGPIRDHKAKTADQIEKLRLNEPQSPKITELEQDLTRTNAQAYVAESQLSNATREKLKAAYITHLTALIERTEKENILAKHGLRLIQLLDDTPVQPGTNRPPFAGSGQASQIVLEAQRELGAWHPSQGHAAATIQPHGGNPVAAQPQQGGYSAPPQGQQYAQAPLNPQGGSTVPPQGQEYAQAPLNSQGASTVPPAAGQHYGQPPPVHPQGGSVIPPQAEYQSVQPGPAPVGGAGPGAGPGP